MANGGVSKVMGFVLLGLLIWTPEAVAAPPEPFPPGQVPYIFDCGHWFPHEPQAARGLFDVYWTGEQQAAREREAIQSVDGVVVHEFGVAAVRARLWVARIPQIWGTRVESAASPPDYTVKVVIGMPTPLSTSDSDFLAGLGAVMGRADYNKVHARVPDSAIPTIRAHAGVQWVRADGTPGCLD
jgi:hypothetical protein